MKGVNRTISRAAIDPVADIVDRSNVAALIEEAIAEEAGVGGRKRWLPIRTLLIGMMLTPGVDHASFVTKVHKTLCDFHPRLRARYRIVREDGSLITYQQVWRAYDAMRSVLDGSPYLGGYGLSEEVRDMRDSRLQTFSNKLLEATLPDDIPHQGSYAIDATDIDSWSRPWGSVTNRADGSGAQVLPDDQMKEHRAGSPSSKYRFGVSDPDAAKYARKRWKAREKGDMGAYGYGYRMDAAVWVPEDDGGPVPLLAARIVVSANTNTNVLNAAELIETLALDGFPIGDVLVDSEYPVADGFSQRIRAAGGSLIGNLHPNIRGRGGSLHGALVIDGDLYSPSMPDRLRNLTPPAVSATRAEIAARCAEYDERDRYRLQQRNRTPDTTGLIRFACPAVAGRIACPFRPESIPLTIKRGSVVETLLPAVPGPVCTAQTVSVDIGTEAADGTAMGFIGKAHQRLSFYTTAWYLSFNRRERVEGFFGNVKTYATQDLRRGTNHLMGRAANQIAATMVCASANMRLLAKFRRDLPDYLDGNAAVPTTDLWEQYRKRETARLRRAGHPRHAPRPQRRVATMADVGHLLPDPAPPG